MLIDQKGVDRSTGKYVSLHLGTTSGTICTICIQGLLVDFKLHDVTRSTQRECRFVCVNPPAMSRLVYLLHGDDAQRSFKVDAKRFWPEDLGWKRPNPRVVLDALEDVVKYGRIRERLLPLLWQVGRHGEKQSLWPGS